MQLRAEATELDEIRCAALTSHDTANATMVNEPLPDSPSTTRPLLPTQLTYCQLARPYQRKALPLPAGAAQAW